MDQGLRDRNNFPINPWARSHILFAGIDIVRAFRVLLFDRHVDAVVCVFENTALVILAFRRLFRFKPPVLLYEVSSRGWRWRDWMLDFVMPRIDQALTLTQHSKQHVESCYRLKRPAIVTGYFIDETFFRPDAPLTTSQQVPDDFILAVGDDHSRDYGTLLRACTGLDVPVVLRTRLNPAIPQELLDRVTVIPDRLPYRGLRDLYRRARLVVVPLHPTENPGGITSLFEAMAMGRPVICSATGTATDYVRHGETGLLVPPDDSQALEATIRRLLNHPDEARRLGAAARRYVEQELTIYQFTARMAAAIKMTVG
ncbi:MAG: glycosyltransferase family 4 protein [Acidobacteria bacterium]|nr:glycosyltransferase family 4 protein [Acidobacteriota bacterium]